MTVRKQPLMLVVGVWLAILLMGLLGSNTVPSLAFADGAGGDTIPFQPRDTTGNNDGYGGDDETNPDEPSVLELFVNLLQALL